MRLARFGGGLILGIWAYVLSRQSTSVPMTFLMFTLIGLASDAWLTVLKETIAQSLAVRAAVPGESPAGTVHRALLNLGLTAGCIALGAFGMHQTLLFLIAHATGSGGLDSVGWLFWLLAIAILFGAPTSAAICAATFVGQLPRVLGLRSPLPLYSAASFVAGAGALACTGYLTWRAALTTIPHWPPQ